ncbi:MAG: NADH-quinone oxidoreductase subunit N [Acidobacteria bacterium]|nr:NADH-quinone oxidoreductase subunit N [Acidobacteriota bacterium]
MWTEFFQPIDFQAIVPHLELTIFACGILLMDFLLDREHKHWNGIAALIGVVFSGIGLWQLRHVSASPFKGLLQVDPFFITFGFISLAATALVILMSLRYMDVEGEHEGEYYALILFATVGMLFIAGGTDLITLFIGLELMALSFYVLAGYLRADPRSNEAAIKYFLLGAFSSGILVYGFSLLYGISGSTNINVIAEIVRQRALTEQGRPDAIIFLATITIAAGMFFKVAAVPFHQWAPDVYEGAPTTITAYVSVASKAASLAMLLRLFLIPINPVRPNWEDILIVVAVLTMTVGNLAAITQENVKRLLAYSSIGHVGYILLGIVAGNRLGLMAVVVYIIVYAFMTLGAFAVVVGMRRKDLLGDQISDMAGLFFKNPAPAVLMIIFLLSLAGIPPTAGFWGKYLIFAALIESERYVLAVIAVLYVAVALYYYFRIVVSMFMAEPREPGKMTLAPGLVVSLAVTCLLTLLPGIYPEPLFRLANFAVFRSPWLSP